MGCVKCAFGKVRNHISNARGLTAGLLEAELYDTAEKQTATKALYHLRKASALIKQIEDGMKHEAEEGEKLAEIRDKLRKAIARNFPPGDATMTEAMATRETSKRLSASDFSSVSNFNTDITPEQG